MEKIIRAAELAPTTRSLRRPVQRVAAVQNEPQNPGGPNPPPNPTPNPTPNPNPMPKPGAAQGATASAGTAPAPAPAPGLFGLRPPAATPAPNSTPSPIPLAAESEDSGEMDAQTRQTLARLAQEQQREGELAAAKAKAEAEKKGYQDGLAKGEVAGKQAAQKKLQEQTAQLLALCTQLQKLREEMVSKAEDTMVEIVYESLCRIIGEQSGQKEMVLGMVGHVLSEFRQHEPLVLLMHPQDLALVQQALPELGINPEQTQLRADPSLKMGGCLVESAVGTLDASLETQFSRLRDLFLQVRRGEEYGGEFI